MVVVPGGKECGAALAAHPDVDCIAFTGSVAGGALTSDAFHMSAPEPTGTYAARAIAGAFTTCAWGLHAIWVPAGLLAVTLILLVINEREGAEP